MTCCLRVTVSFMWYPSKKRGLRAFNQAEDGSATIEFVLWLPLLMTLVLVATDASVAFMRQSHMWQVSRDTARIVSRHGMTEAAAETYAETNARFGDTVPSVSVTAGTGQVAVAITTPARAMTIFGTLNFALDETITTRVIHTMEPTS